MLSISISMLTFSTFRAHRLRFRLGSVWTLGLVPPSFFLGLGRMGEVARGRAWATPPLWAHRRRFVGETGKVTSAGDRATCGKMDSSPEKNLILFCLLSENTVGSL